MGSRWPEYQIKQSKEFSDGGGLNEYDYQARNYSPQIGRFTTADPKCELYPHYTSYAYCFNNPILFVDPDGMQAKYNWNNQQYEDNGQFVSWDEVQQQYGIGDYASNTSVMLAPQFESDGKTKKYDYGTGTLTAVVNAAVQTGNIRVLHTKDADDAADQIEDIKVKIDNLFILGHGDSKNALVDGKRHSAYFAIGSDNYHISDVFGSERKSKALERMAATLAITPGLLPSAAEVIVFACGVGGTYNGGAELMQALAKKLHATVYGNQSLSCSSSSIFFGDTVGFSSDTWPAGHDPNGAFSNSFQNAERWTKISEFGGTPISQTVTNVYLDSFGKIYYSQ